MSAGTVAAVDLGATSGLVVVGHVGPGTLTTTTVARFPNEAVRAGDVLHWDILALYGAGLDGLREAFRQNPEIVSVGVDAWAVDYGLFRAGRLLSNPVHYRDPRTAAGVAAVHERVPHEQLFERNGLQFLPFNTLYQLASEPRDVLEFADTMLLVPDLISYWLSGHAHAERTNASTTGLLRVHDGVWNDELIAALGIPRSILPPLVSPGTQLDPLRESVRASIGAPEGVAVTAVGSHDTASAIVAVPMRPDAAAYISCGTWGLVGVEVERPIVTAAALAGRFTNEGGVDGRIRLLRNVMGLWVLSETVREWERADGERIDLQTLLGAAADVPAASVPVFDINDARFLAPGGMTERIEAWCREHDVAPPTTRAGYARGIVESLAQAFADAARDAGVLGGVDVQTIHVVGGGALNELLCQRTADRAGMTVLAGPVEATALGNVLVQARGAGFVHGSLESLRDLVARTHAPRRHEPRSQG